LTILLGKKAKMNLEHNSLTDLPKGTYTLKITDISGAYWEHEVKN
jgi:thiosulfate dehydrogenase [quinone] large subunit